MYTRTTGKAVSPGVLALLSGREEAEPEVVSMEQHRAWHGQQRIASHCVRSMTVTVSKKNQKSKEAKVYRHGAVICCLPEWFRPFYKSTLFYYFCWRASTWAMMHPNTPEVSGNFDP